MKHIGIGLFGLIMYSLMTVALVILRANTVITWDWLWVLAPLWVPMSIMLVAIIGSLAVIFWSIEKDEDVDEA